MIIFSHRFTYSMFKWLGANKSWVFSGFGVALSGFIISQFIGKTDTQNQNGSSNIQAGGDVHITYPDPKDNYSKRLDNQQKTINNLYKQVNDLKSIIS